MAEDLTSPIVAYGSYARWKIYPISGEPFEFSQRLPQITDPAKDIVPFIERVYAATRDGKIPRGINGPSGFTSLWSDGGLCNTDPDLISSDPFIVTFYCSWYEAVAKKLKGKVAYEWELWLTATGIEGSFRRYDADGRIVPIHDISRRPLADLAEALSVSADLQKLFMAL